MKLLLWWSHNVITNCSLVSTNFIISVMACTFMQFHGTKVNDLIIEVKLNYVTPV